MGYRQPRKTVVLKVVADDAAFPSVADGAMYYRCPDDMDGYKLDTIGAHVYTASDGGTAINIDLYNVTDGVDILSTALTIDNNETDSSTAGTSAVINASNDDIAAGDVLRVDVNQCGTNAQGFELRMSFVYPA